MCVLLLFAHHKTKAIHCTDVVVAILIVVVVYRWKVISNIFSKWTNSNLLSVSSGNINFRTYMYKTFNMSVRPLSDI